MRSFKIALCAAMFAVPAVAADLPSHKSAPAFISTAPSWTGIYGGIEAGYAWGNHPNVPLSAYSVGYQLQGNVLAPVYVPYAIGAMANMTLNENGPIGGAQVGYRYQMNRWVLGAEMTWDALVGPRKSATFASAGLGVTPNVAQLGSAWRWAMTFDPSVGFLLTPNLLIYGGGGFALAQLDRSITIGSGVQLSGGQGVAGKVLPGWNVKAGAEWMFAPGWSAGIEARYFDFGKRTAAVSGVGYGDIINPFVPATQFVATSRADAFSVLVRLNRQIDFFKN